ncbi:MAG: BatA domain-containing protein [Bacteroidota bacterium]
MSFGMTVWLWLTAAAMIPLIIHLWNRRAGKPHILPTFRFLPETSFSRAGSIELHEIWLLLLRIGLIVLVALLLTGLFFEGEKEPLQSVKITETNAEYSEEWIGDGILEISVPTERIDRVGWWKLLEQVDYDYRPGLMIVEGDLNVDRFRGNVPELYADLEWIERDLQEEFWQASWLNLDDSQSGYVQRRYGKGVVNRIEDVQDTPSDSETLQLFIRSDADPAIRRGFEDVSTLWKIELTDDDLPENQIAIARFGDREIVLNRTATGENSMHRVMPGPQFGVNIPVTVMEDSIEVLNPMVQTELTHIPVFWMEGKDELVLNAEPATGFTQWFYAGVAHQLLKTAAGIDETITPEITEELRTALTAEEVSTAGLVERKSASTWLFLLLLLMWTAERILSQRRDM